MRIRMLVDMPEGAARNGQPWPAKGGELDVPTADAAHLVASGVAEEIDEPAEQDTEEEPPAGQRRRRRKAAESEEG
ncbi:hypothetical protein ABT320_09640 [Streptomyces cellulosae]